MLDITLTHKANRIFSILTIFKLGLLFSLILLCMIPKTKSFEDQEEFQKRFKFYSKIQQYSNNTIKVGNDPEAGLTCIANDYIPYAKLTLQVPKKLSICPYYIFPFKYEIISALQKVQGLNETLGTEQRFPVYLLTYYLMYLKSGLKDKINQYIKLKNMTDYYELTEIDESILDSFPKSVLSMGNFDPEHFQLIRQMNYQIDKDQELDAVFKVVLQDLSFSKDFEVTYPWISDFSLFKWAYSIVMSRGMTLRLNEYYNLESIKISDPNIPNHIKKNIKTNAYIGKNVGCPCIIAFIDLCNHYQPKNIYGTDKLPIVLDTKPGFFLNSAVADWNPGDEITYTYANDPNNLILMSHYGFYLKDNNYNEQKIYFEEDYNMGVEQFNLCKEVGCFDAKIRSVNQVPKSRNENIVPYTLNENLLNYARVKYLKPKFDAKNTLKKLLVDKKVSHLNELSAYLFYYKIMKDNLDYHGKIIEADIKEGQTLKNKISELEKNWNKIDNVEALWKKFKISYNLFMMDLNFKNILVKHANVILNRILNETNNDIMKLRAKYIESGRN